MQQDKQKYDCSVYSTGSVKPSEEDTKSACQKAEGSFCHPEIENDETFFFFFLVSSVRVMTTRSLHLRRLANSIPNTSFHIGSASTEELEKYST